VKPEGSQPYSQKPVTGAYPEPDESKGVVKFGASGPRLEIFVNKVWRKTF